MNLTKRRDASFPSGQARALTSFTVRDVPGRQGLVTVRQGTTLPATDAVVRKAPTLFVDSGVPEQSIGRLAPTTPPGGLSTRPRWRGPDGLTPAEVGALIAVQGGACALCGRTGEALQVDHDHRHCPGREGCRQCVRGLLCPRCNTALGKLGDHRIPRLIEYLSR